MVDIQYLILFTPQGIPVYSHKFIDENSIALSDEVLFSAFLASLNTIGRLDDEAPDTIFLGDQELTIEYSEELKLSTLTMGDLALIFYNLRTNDLITGIGVNARSLNKFNALFQISQLMTDTEKFMAKHNDVNWASVDKSVLDMFDTLYLTEVIHNYVNSHTAFDFCFLDNLCPYRLAPEPEPVEEPKKSFSDRLKDRFTRDNEYSTKRF